MRKFSTVKEALGYMAGHRKGPRMASLRFEPRVQNSVKLDRGEWVRLVGVLTDVCADTGADRERLLGWASATDGAVAVEGRMGAALKLLRERLAAAGLLEPKVEPVQHERHRFLDLNTGEWVETWRTLSSGDNGSAD